MSSTTEAKIAELEHEYARTQKNKATEGHLGLIKAKLAKLRRELEAQGTKSSGEAPASVLVRREDEILSRLLAAIARRTPPPLLSRVE